MPAWTHLFFFLLGFFCLTTHYLTIFFYCNGQMPKRANYIQLPRITTNYNLSFCTQTQAALADRKMQNSLQQQTEFHAHHSVERPDATQKIGCFGLANRVNFVPSSISHRKPGFWCPVFDRICIVLGENPQCLRSVWWIKMIKIHSPTCGKAKHSGATRIFRRCSTYQARSPLQFVEMPMDI